MKAMQRIKKAICFMMVGVILLFLPACQKDGTPVEHSKYQPVKLSKNTVDLMENVTAGKGKSKAPNHAFLRSSADFAIKLFKQSMDKNKNSMISPLSVMIALSMTANGADGNTLAQMEKLLGGSIRMDDLNQYLSAYLSGLPSSKKAKLSVANSIWFRNEEDRLTVKEAFLKTNASYYNAGVYSAPFDQKTLKDINTWISKKTDGMVKDVLKEIPGDAVMYLINALAFDAEWETIYKKDQIHKSNFYAMDGTSQTVSMMHSTESQYLDDKKATGFLKPYAEGYSFVALLPNEDVSIEDYVASLSGDSFVQTISKAKDGIVNATMPKFSSEYTTVMNDALQTLGMKDAFDIDIANFTKLGNTSDGNLFVSKVLHKTFICVDERGTKAGAATVVEMNAGCAIDDYYTVTLDRPFVYAIVDNSTNLPLFIGTVLKVEK